MQRSRRRKLRAQAKRNPFALLERRVREASTYIRNGRLNRQQRRIQKALSK